VKEVGMVDRYERDDEGNVAGKAAQPHPAGPKDPSPSINGRPVDVAGANSTFASRAAGERDRPDPLDNPNSTFAARKAKAAQRGKRVGAAENKAVTEAEGDEPTDEKPRGRRR
jgi:hypothetical protein